MSPLDQQYYDLIEVKGSYQWFGFRVQFGLQQCA